MDKAIKGLLRKGQNIARGLGHRGHLLKGSIVRYYNVCGKKECRCKRGKKHGPYLYVSVYEGKKTRLVYVPKGMEKKVYEWVGNLRELQRKVSEISQLNVEVLKRLQKGSKKG